MSYYYELLYYATTTSVVKTFATLSGKSSKSYVCILQREGHGRMKELRQGTRQKGVRYVVWLFWD